jgi:hypothetical protein
MRDFPYLRKKEKRKWNEMTSAELGEAGIEVADEPDPRGRSWSKGVVGKVGPWFLVRFDQLLHGRPSYGIWNPVDAEGNFAPGYWSSITSTKKLREFAELVRASRLAQDVRSLPLLDE